MRIRRYTPADERSWLRCRVLSLLGTAYFDDVVTAKPEDDAPVQLVAVAGAQVIGLLDATLEASRPGCDATLENVAVHPDHQHAGIGSALLAQALSELGELGARRIEAWTRDDAATLRWYGARGFGETSRYLHVYANSYRGDPVELPLIATFAHAPIEEEARMRATYRRVHVCRSYERDVTLPART